MHNKSKNLQILKKQGFNVPDFLVCEKWDNFEEKIKNLDKNKTYAVRSDMWVEDSENSSFAGQFKTFINVSFENIVEKIEKVIKDAENKNLEKRDISVIVQEYIVLEYAGICFTRNPEGGYEMIIEYHKWIGEDIVSGNIKPESMKMYHWENEESKNIQRVEALCWIAEWLEFIANIKKIEKIFNFPQDIEWGIANWKVYFFQSRNITTIPENKWEEIKYIDDFVFNNCKNSLSTEGFSPLNNSKGDEQNFLYEKTEISEILPKVTDFSYNLLLKIYAENWPVYNFYKENWLKIETKNFLKIIWDELFIDKQIELQNFFPSLTLFKNKYKTKIIWNKKIFRTFINIIKLNFIKINKNKILDGVEKQIISLNTKNFSLFNLENRKLKHSVDLIEKFIKNYKLIYEINFHTQKEFSKIEIFKEKLWVNLLDYLDTEIVQKNELKNIKDQLNKIDFSEIIWNSFDITDNSKFQTNIFSKEMNKIPKSFKELPTWKQNFIKSRINDLQFFSDLREIWRILTVLNVDVLRKKEKNNNNSPIIPFSSKGDKHKIFNFSNKISDTFIEEENKKINILSNFKAEGELVDLEYLQKNYKKNQKYILFTKNLNPNLVEYFDKIEGIISEKWWALSHLSIMCREYQKMLIICDLKKEDIKIWDYIYFSENNLTKK